MRGENALLGQVGVRGNKTRRQFCAVCSRGDCMNEAGHRLRAWRDGSVCLRMACVFGRCFDESWMVLVVVGGSISWGLHACR